MILVPKTSAQALAHLIFFILAGVGLSLMYGVAEIQALHAADFYNFFLVAVLVVGIYGSVYEIDIHKIAQDKLSLVSIVTLGVILKVGVISVLFYASVQCIDHFFPALEANYNFFISVVFSVAVAQIDPLSVGALTARNSFLSERGKRFLFVWSSFDDPMTVVIAAILTAFILAGGASSAISIDQLSDGAFLVAMAEIGLNFVVPLFAFLVFYSVHKFIDWANIQSSSIRIVVDLLVLFSVLVVSVAFELILATAITALFIRPAFAKFDDLVATAVSVAYMLALLLLGSHLASTLSGSGSLHSLYSLVAAGVVLGIAAVCSQAIAASLFARQLSATDRAYLRWAQQNGITAVILALFFTQAGFAVGNNQIMEIVSIVTVSILAINIIHLISFHFIDNMNKSADT